MDLNNSTLRMIAKTQYGLEQILKSELEALGASEIEVGRRMVAFMGDLRLLYRANIYLRTALNVLVPLATFEATTPDEVYQYLYDHIHWDEYLTPRSTFAFDTVVYSDKFSHSKFVAYRAKDAVVDYFIDKQLPRPNVSVSSPDIYFHIHISNTTVTLALDSSGESLHKRGYRVGQTEAPINEVLAAGMLLQAGWDGQCDFVDPMCGSGTLLIEAALIALGIPPGIFRPAFAFERWMGFDRDLLSEVLDEWDERPFAHTIYGSDLSTKAIGIARTNVQRAGVQKCIQLAVKGIEEYTAETKPAPTGLLVTNPPYGERLKPGDVEQLYSQIGHAFKHAFAGYKAWVISSSSQGFIAIGLKHFYREKLFNGGLECELRGYELFEGKRNDFVKDRVENNEEYARAGEWSERRVDHRQRIAPNRNNRDNDRGKKRDRKANDRKYSGDKGGQSRGLVKPRPRQRPASLPAATVFVPRNNKERDPETE